MSVERLVSSMRGRIIIGTALHIAIKELDKVKGAMRQVSTLEDMKSMLDSDIFINIHDDEEQRMNVALSTQLKEHIVVAYYDEKSPTNINVMITCKSGLRGNVLKLYDLGEIEAIHEVLGQIIQDDDLNRQERLNVPIGEEPF